MEGQKRQAYTDFLSDSSDVECLSSEPTMATFVNQPAVSPSQKNDFYSDGSDDDLPTVPLFARITGQKTSTAKSTPSSQKKYSVLPRSSVATRPSISSVNGDQESFGSSYEHMIEGEYQSEKKKPKTARKQLGSEGRDAKEAEKRRKQEDRERKKREKQQEATKKRLLQEVKKKSSLKECLKLMTVIIDTGLMHYSLGAGLVSSLQESQMNLDVTPQPVSNLITFTRQVTQVKDLPDGTVGAESKEEVEDNMLLYMTAEQFADMALIQLGRSENTAAMPSLIDHVNTIHRHLGKRSLTVLVQGIDDYYRKSKMQKAKKKGNTRNFIESTDVHEVLVELLLLSGCNVNFVEKDPDVLESVMQYAKAVAEAPYKQDRLDTGLDFHLEAGSSVQIDKEAGGLARVWRQQLMTLNNVSTEVANAIAAVYPSPGHLMNAYDKCTASEGQKLLQDIVVRRGYGVLETSRRVGKELSARIHQLFTSTNPNTLLVNNS